ncbi:uncharacterized protein LOC110963751 isoform X2 [Acanthochromis polyacanthus]|uniref:uncharacterized protein LOC110963751 isoform X2 n=1 Tax=Acanthochromis polyacanthus TaxID=80966 RepID=UPI002234AC69|nr:uncharacterized protein LOC110963751 isoform X2 [Acanthochromis polyacanthus]
MGSVPAHWAVVHTDASLRGWGATWQGHMVQGMWAALASYQCSGADSGGIDAAACSPMSTEQACFGEVRQHERGIPYQSPGGHPVSGIGDAHHSDSDLGCSTSGQPESYAYPRRAEHVGGFPVPADASTRGMETSPGGGESSLAGLRQGRSGPVCVQGVHALSRLIQPCGQHGSTGPGCSGTRLARNSPICFSTCSTNLANAAQGFSRGTSIDTDSPILAGQDMVSTAAQALLQLAEAPAVQEGPPVPIRGEDIAPESRSTPAVGLATTGPRISFSEYDGDIGRTIANARAPSTWRLYASR